MRTIHTSILARFYNLSSGFKDGAVQATEKSNTRQMDFNMLNERLLTIKGIGIVKAEQIVKVVKGALESE